MNKTSIEWTDYSVNPFKMQMPDGTLINVCVHKSDGCRNCYAEMIVRRWWKKEWGEYPGYTAALLKLGKPVLVEKELRAVIRLSQRIAEGKADPKENKIFWNDMTDEALEFWPDRFLDVCWAVRALTPNLIHQVLTKRIDRVSAYVRDLTGDRVLTTAFDIGLLTPNREHVEAYAGIIADESWPLSNVWLGVSVEDQKTADERIPLLLQTPAAVRWISAEPLLGHIDLDRWLCFCPVHCEIDGGTFACSLDPYLDLVVIGGESGSQARRFYVPSARAIVRQCKRAGIAVFVKQFGSFVVDRNDAGFDGCEPESWPVEIEERGAIEYEIDGYVENFQGADVRIRLRNSKGNDPSEWPEDLRVRKLPISSPVTRNLSLSPMEADAA